MAAKFKGRAKKNRLHVTRFFHKRRGESCAAKMTPVEDGSLARVTAHYDYSCTTTSGSSCRRAVNAHCDLTG